MRSRLILLQQSERCAVRTNCESQCWTLRLFAGSFRQEYTWRPIALVKLNFKSLVVVESYVDHSPLEDFKIPI